MGTVSFAVLRMRKALRMPFLSHGVGIKIKQVRVGNTALGSEAPTVCNVTDSRKELHCSGCHSPAPFLIVPSLAPCRSSSCSRKPWLVVPALKLCPQPERKVICPLCGGTL